MTSMSTAATLDLLTDNQKHTALASINGDRLLLIPDPLYNPGDEHDPDSLSYRIAPGYMVIAYNGTRSIRVGRVYDTRETRPKSRRPKNCTTYAYEAERPHGETYDDFDPDSNPWENAPVDTWRNDR
jgi:hypothetical protein